MVPWPIRNGMWLALAAAWAASPASQGIAEDAAVATVDAFAAAVRQAEIAFNTLVNVRTPFEIGTPGRNTRLPPVDSVVANNLVQGTRGPAVHRVIAPDRFTWAGNLLAGPGTTGLPGDVGWRCLGPCLERTAEGRWELRPGSPAVDAADPATPPPAEDIDGQPRPTGTAADVGCDEVSETRPICPPLSVRTTGPTWLAGR